MSTVAVEHASPVVPSPWFKRIAWHLRHNRKADLWIAWWTMVVFYILFGIVFVLMTHVMPPPSPAATTEQVVQWFGRIRTGILDGFSIIFLITGMAAVCNAIIAYSMSRMSVSKAFPYAYILLYSLSAIPGMLYSAILLSVGALRPDRDPALLHWLYDGAFLAFMGTMGIFLLGTLVWLIAILIDKNRVLPPWFGYLNICNLLTEVVVAPCWTQRRGAFSWSGSISFWVDTLIFALYTVAFILVLRRMVEREDFGTGALP